MMSWFQPQKLYIDFIFICTSQFSVQDSARALQIQNSRRLETEGKIRIFVRQLDIRVKRLKVKCPSSLFLFLAGLFL